MKGGYVTRVTFKGERKDYSFIVDYPAVRSPDHLGIVAMGPHGLVARGNSFQDLVRNMTKVVDAHEAK